MTTRAPAPPKGYIRTATGEAYELKAMEIWGGSDAAAEHMATSGFDAWIYSTPHEGDHQGGDLRFAATCAAEQIVRFTIADLAGHGREAAEMATSLRALMRKHINTPNPTKFARALNQELSRQAAEGRFATAVITTYFAPTDHLIVNNAGHPRPLLYHAATKSWELFDQNSACVLQPERSRDTGIANLPLGVLDPTNYPQFATRLEPGDIVVVYTDALIESTTPDGRMFGEEGLLAAAKSLDASTPATIGPSLVAAAAAWRAGKPTGDDETVLVLYHTGTNPPDSAWHRVKALTRALGLMR